jgi:hypothetical protein
VHEGNSHEQITEDRDLFPDAFSVSWQYPDFVMTFTNAVVQNWEFGGRGTTSTARTAACWCIVRGSS